MENRNIEQQNIIPLNDAMNWFEGKFRNSELERVLGMRISASFNGNKQWEIGISVLRIVFRIGKMCIGKKYECSLACYRRQGFTTFCSSVEGCELWFDCFELATASISKRDPVFADTQPLIIL